jgi:Uncharacterised nucleotidyltransferase/Glycosyltransferase (GlcNAc)
MDNIFIQIAAYRDLELIPTVQDAISQATYPERIGFGICWQYESQAELDYLEPLKTINNCRIKSIPARESRGLGWARSQTEKLWQGERYTLQIDAHMRFAEGWDSLLLEMLSMCPSEKPILTAYPPGYEPPRNLLSDIPSRLIAGSFSEVGVLTPRGDGDLTQSTTPEVGAFVAGGFMFADASIIRQVPHDPNIYFSCTEVLYAARAWTRGWDIYYPHRPVCWHYYNNETQGRILHWTDHQKWGELNQVSQQRFRQILKMEPSTKNFGIYNLGKTRTLTEYEVIANVNFRAWSKKTELDLLLCCIHTHIDPATSEQISTLLQQEIDWNYLYEIATQYQVLPLLYWTLDRHFREAVPVAMLSQLQTDFDDNSQRNTILAQELIDLINLFQSHEIPAIPFKGPILAALAYDHLFLRQFSDLDILVHPRDRQKAQDLMLSQGYDLRGELDWEYGFFHPQRQVSVYFQQAIRPSYCPFPLKFEDLWSHLRSVSIAGKILLSLQPEDLLLILVSQSAKDFLEEQPRLIRLCDVAELIRNHQEMDWEYVLTQARLLGNQTILFFSLLLATDMLGTVLPENVRHRMDADSVANLLLKHVSGQLFFPQTHLVRGALFYFSRKESLCDKLFNRVSHSLNR